MKAKAIVADYDGSDAVLAVMVKTDNIDEKTFDELCLEKLLEAIKGEIKNNNDNNADIEMETENIPDLTNEEIEDIKKHCCWVDPSGCIWVKLVDVDKLYVIGQI